MASKITGRVTEVLVDEGMRVEAGQVLARLDDADARRRTDATRASRDVARASLEEIKVNLADAQRRFRRTQELHEDGVASEQDLDSATAAVDALGAQLAVAQRNLDAAEAQLAVAVQDLENYTIRAPFAGIAVSKEAQPGEMVAPVFAGGGGISTIVDMTSLEIEVDVNESYIARVAPGQPAEAILDAYPGWRIPATVRTIIPTADRQKATVKVRLTFDELDPRILPDMGVKVAFRETAGEIDDAPRALCLIPAQRDPSVTATARWSSWSTARPSSAGRSASVASSGSDIEILAGLSAGALVVVEAPGESRGRTEDQDPELTASAARRGDIRRMSMVRVDGTGSDNALIQVRNLNKQYKRGSETIDVLQGLNLDVEAGEFVAFMGPSGSGKTTLLNLLGGLDVPTSGTVTVDGDEITHMSGPKLAKWRARHVGFIFQMYNLMPVLTAAQNVELPLLLTKLSKSRRRQQVETALSLVGLADRMDHYPRQLSGGQEQRVAIARAIVTDPTFILADEPTGDLDRQSADEILDLITALSKEHGKTILMVTHDPRAAERADVELHLEKGVLVEAGRTGVAS